MKCRSEKEGKVDAAIADDGSREGDNKADGEHAGEGEEKTGGGEGLRRERVGLVWLNCGEFAAIRIGGIGRGRPGPARVCAE